jgi:hypothetical protein
MADDIVREVPEALQKLARLVCKGFYDPESNAIMEIIFKHRHGCASLFDMQVCEGGRHRRHAAAGRQNCAFIEC